MAVPHIIHQYWSGSEVPEEFREYSWQWNKLHPEWIFLHWNDERIDCTQEVRPFHNKYLFDHASEISPKAPYQFKADVLRYELLYLWGGVWIDMDFKPQKPITNLCDDTDCWTCWEEYGRWINNAIMGATPKHPAIKRIIDQLPINVSKCLPYDGNTVKSGPQFITPYLIDCATIYPREYFFPYLWNELHREKEEFPEAYAIHKWNHRRSLKR